MTPVDTSAPDAGTRSLSRMMDPRSIAVVGASNRTGHFANQPLVNLRRFGFTGEVYPVNPSNDEVAGYRCYPSLDELPKVPDLAVVVVRPELAVSTVRRCGELGVAGVVVVGSGFAETNSADGHLLQGALAAAVTETGVRLCGPNTLGIANFHSGAVSYASGNLPAEPRIGPVAVVSQSGGCSFTLLNRAWRIGVGVCHVAVAGNELDVSIPEFIEYYLQRDEVKSVACYIEAIRDPDGLRRVGELAQQLGKPVFVMKSGASELGQRAAAAHTGALASSDAVCGAALEQWGLVRARTFDELIGAAALAARFGVVGAQRFGVYAQGGGVAVVASDLFADANLELAQLTPATAAKLKARMPDTTPGNPFDSGGQFLSSGASVLTEGLNDFADDPNVSSVVYMLMPVAGARLGVYTEGIVNAATQSAKPSVVLQYGAGAITQASTDQIIAADILLLDPPESGVSALRLWSGSASRFRGPGRVFPRRTDPGAVDRARILIDKWRVAGRRTISEYDASELLGTYGIKQARQLLVTEKDQIAPMLATLRSPYVVKISSDDVPHRSDVGGVVLGLDDESEVLAAYDSVLANVRSAHPNAALRGVTVSETVPAGVELILGVKQDNLFGPVVIIGMGGIYAEVWEDTALRLPPLEDRDVIDMLDQLRSAPLLRGARGRPGVDLDALVDVVIRMAELAVDLSDDLVAVEVNPLIVAAAGGGVLAVDALVELTSVE